MKSIMVVVCYTEGDYKFKLLLEKCKLYSTASGHYLETQKKHYK